MASIKNRLPWLIIVLLLVLGGVLLWQNNDKGSKTPNPAQNAPASLKQDTSVSTAKYSYQKPTGWATLAGEDLAAKTAESGIIRIAKPSGIFTVKVNSGAPTADELKNSTLDDIKKNAPNFTLVSSTATKVDNQTAQTFVYTFTDSSNDTKVRQQLTAVAYKGNTYFLLFALDDKSFSQIQSDFDKIQASFKFK